MKLYYTNEVPEISPTMTCRQKRLATTIGNFIFILIIAGIPVVMWYNDVTLWATGFMFLFTMLFVPAMLRGLIGVNRASNWVLKTEPDGLWINFRSYIHYRFDNADSVVWIENSEIEQVYEKAEFKFDRGVGNNKPREVKITSLIIELNHDEIDELKSALKAENTRRETSNLLFGLIKSTTRTGHIVMSIQKGNLLEIHWKDSRSLDGNSLTPPIEEVLDHLSAQVTVGEPIEVQKKKEDREAMLVQMVEENRTIAAVKLARNLYGYDLTEAKDFVEALKAKQAEK